MVFIASWSAVGHRGCLWSFIVPPAEWGRYTHTRACDPITKCMVFLMRGGSSTRREAQKDFTNAKCSARNTGSLKMLLCRSQAVLQEQLDTKGHLSGGRCRDPSVDYTAPDIHQSPAAACRAVFLARSSSCRQATSICSNAGHMRLAGLQHHVPIPACNSPPDTGCILIHPSCSHGPH